MIRSQQASHSILKQVLFFSTNSLCRLMAADDKTSGEKKKSSSSSNIDLFAAGERKIPKATVPVVNLVAAEKTIASVVDRIPVPLSAPIPVSSSSGKSTTGSNENVLPLTAASLAPSASRNNLIELQAELLRLEAEKEQLEIDQQRIDEEKVGGNVFESIKVISQINSEHDRRIFFLENLIQLFR